jgi:hypothetical protein
MIYFDLTQLRLLVDGILARHQTGYLANDMVLGHIPKKGSTPARLEVTCTWEGDTFHRKFDVPDCVSASESEEVEQHFCVQVDEWLYRVKRATAPGLWVSSDEVAFPLACAAALQNDPTEALIADVKKAL